MSLASLPQYLVAADVSPRHLIQCAPTHVVGYAISDTTLCPQVLRFTLQPRIR